MGVTHHQQIQVTGTTQLSGPVIMTGANQTTLTKLSVTGTTRASGIFSASAAGKQSTLTKLNVSGTVALSGNVAATASGKKVTMGAVVVPSAANAMSGRRYIATAGTTAFSIATTKVQSSSRIFLTPVAASAAHAAKHHGNLSVNTIASGGSFSIRSTFGVTPTGATGTIDWLIINVA